ncbi:hypothetical protein ACFL02_02350, partial [Planctomycetota bacterium]
GTYAWTVNLGGGQEDAGWGIAVDSSDNVLVTGQFWGTVDFNPSPHETDSHTAAGHHDIYVTKLNSDGSYGWTVTFGGGFSDKGSDIAADSMGNVFVTGYFEFFADFDPTDGSSDIHYANGPRDIFITKLDPDGGYGWTKTFGGNQWDDSNEIAVDALGSVFFTGFFSGSEGSEIDFDPTEGTDLHTAGKFNKSFVTKLNGDGSYGWTAVLGSTNIVLGYDVAVDSANNVLATGYFSGTADLDPTDGTDPFTAVGNRDFYITKLKPNYAPAIGSVTANPPPPDPVTQGDNLTLTANDVTDVDSSVVKVEFYRDSNNNGNFELYSDTLLGADINGNDGWSLIIPTDSIPFGENLFFVRALDNDGGRSDEKSIAVRINSRPSINSFIDSPDPAPLDSFLTLTADDITDADETGGAKKVEFYRDTNKNGILDIGGSDPDDHLGDDTDGSNGWSWTGLTTGFNHGLNRYFARAQDFDNAWSEVVSTTGHMNYLPIIDSLSGNHKTLTIHDELTLTANDVNDSDGVVTSVEFYQDANDNRIFEAQTDLLLGVDDDGADGWSWTILAGGLPIGEFDFFARAQDNNDAFSDAVTTSATVVSLNIPAGSDLGFYKTVKYTDVNGDLVTFKLNQGTANLYFLSDDLLTKDPHGRTVKIIDGRAELIDIQMLNSDHRTNLSFGVKKGNDVNADGYTTLGGISGNTLGKVIGKRVDLTGEIDLDGSLKSLILHDIYPDAPSQSLSISTGSAAKGLNVKANNIADVVSFNIADTIKSIQVSTFEGGSVTADIILSLRVKQGSLNADVTTDIGPIKSLFAFNDINGDITAVNDSINNIISKNGDINGNILALINIKSVKANKGSISGVMRAQNIKTISAWNLDQAWISVADEIRTVNVKNDVIESYVLAGYDLGMPSAQEAFNRYDTSDDHLLEGGNIRLFKFKGIFQDSYVTAGAMIDQIYIDLFGGAYSGADYSRKDGLLGRISGPQDNIITDNGGVEFGFYYTESITTNLQPKDNFVIMSIPTV